MISDGRSRNSINFWSALDGAKRYKIAAREKDMDLIGPDNCVDRSARIRSG
ncbi:hypothetical protein [Tatumella citrea]|uniref:hypothetical protein n=1 Tax=Tatumella citrea TaxID=53336 RepID=UPI00146D97C9|nr:hypothetical protein [Tatumella citrea]